MANPASESTQIKHLLNRLYRSLMTVNPIYS